MLAILYYFIIAIVIIIDFIGVSGFDPFYYGLLFFNFFNSVFRRMNKDHVKIYVS